MAGGGTLRPQRRRAPPGPGRPALAAASPGRLQNAAGEAAWWLASISLFAAIWEASWLVGWVNPAILPPPHIFLRDFLEQAKFFGDADSIGHQSASTVAAVTTTILATCLRVIAGLALGFLVSVALGVAIRYFNLFGKIVLPTITLLAPVSPLAWLPVAIALFGIGNGPAVFLVFIAVFFIIVLATISQIDGVTKTYRDVARIMGASRRQMYRYVILPAILPGLFVILRLNLFAAWMMVLVAEAAGVGSGLGQIINLARNTSNATLVFFAITIIGLLGFGFDVALLWIQRRVLYWVPQDRRFLAK